MREYQIGILGANGILGRELLTWLEKWHFPCMPFLFDNAESCGQLIPFRNHHLPLYRYDQAKNTACDIVFVCDDSGVFMDDWRKEHAYVIDLNQAKIQGKCILPNVNLEDFTKEDHIIQVPKAAFIVLANMLSIIKQKTIVSSIHLTSLHSVSELGDQGCRDLRAQLHAYAKNQSIESKQFPLETAFQHLPLLFQALPQTTPFLSQGASEEEATLHEECKTCLNWHGDINATCVRIASMRGLSVSVSFTCEEDVNPETMIDRFSANPQFICYDDIDHNMYPICADVIHDHRIYIGRMRKQSPHTFMAWAVCDDLAIRCGAAVKLAWYIVHNFV